MFRRFCLCLSLLILSSYANSSFAAEADTVQEPADQLVSPLLLRHAGLDIGWTKDLFVKKDETLERIEIYKNYLIVITSQNFLYCLNRNSGDLVFSLSVAEEGLPIHGPSFYENTMLFMVGNQLEVIDMEIGRISHSRNFHLIGNSSVYKPVRNDKLFYILGSNKRLHALDAEQTALMFQATSDDDVMINSVYADNEYLVFATITGHIIRIKIDKPEKIWEYEVGGIDTPMVRDANSIYISSLDRKLYKLDIETGENRWLTSALIGEALRTPPRIGENVVYQYAGVKGFFAVDKATGRKKWQLKNGFDLLAEKGGKAYCLTKKSRLVVMDNAAESKIFSLNMADVDIGVANTVDSKIYVADEKGTIMNILTK